MSDTIWTPSQRTAIEYNYGDLLVSAAAGSGKTATMTQRITEKIISGTDISKILAVTFTKESANELKSRICASLSKILKENPKNERIASQLIKASGADISTIDSFCLKIVRPNFDKLGIDGNFRICDSNEADVLMREAMDEVLDTFYESDKENSDFLLVSDSFSSFSSENELGDQLMSLYRKLISTPDSINTLIKDDDSDCDFMKSKYGAVLIKYTERFLDYYKSVYEFATEEISAANEKFKVGYLPTFEKDLDIINRLKSEIRTSGYDELCCIFASYTPEKLAILRGCPENLDRIKKARKDFCDEFAVIKSEYFSSSSGDIKYAAVQNKKICHAIYDILSMFEKEFQSKKRAHSVCDFNDIERFALRLLYDENGNVSSIANDIASKYDEICIDEYQDTNSVQDKIFKAISRNNRFMVGDIKQSIYRFRSAEPEIFAAYRNNFKAIGANEKSESNPNGAGRSLFMSENFRCDKGVINFVNLVSDYTFTNSDGIPYNESDRLIFSKKVPNNHVHLNSEIYLVEKQNENITEEDFVASKIKDLLAKSELENGKKIKPSDIAILIRNFSTSSPKYIDALKRYGIPTKYCGNDSFFEKSEVLLILCILNSVDNPSRDIYLAGALRSAVFGFTMEEIIALRKGISGQVSLYNAVVKYTEFPKSDPVYEKCTNFLSKMKEYRQAARKLPSDALIIYIYNDIGILSACNADERKNLLKFYDVARKYEGTSFKGLYPFLKYVEKISANESKEDFGSSEDSVRIMSIHASKGLEFEVCFICNTSSPFNNANKTSPIIFNKNLGIAGYVSREDGTVKFNTIMRKCASLAVEMAEREELLRVLYVAMTRARTKLCITASLSKPHEKLLNAHYGRKFTSPYSIYSASSYIEWILGAAAFPQDFFDTFIINSESESEKESETTDNAKEAYSNAEVEKYRKIFEERFDFKYKYDYLEKIPSKLSISKLEPTILDGTENDTIELKDVSLNDAPSFIASKTESNAALKGTATHIFMQFCDFDLLNKKGVEAEMERLVEKAFISESTASLVNMSHIEKFAHSPLFFDIMKAKKVLREFRFNIMLNASEFSEDRRLEDEKVLVQGVCDCIYEDENSNLVLVDYKTDRVTEQNYENVLKERHSMQLLYYKKACEMMFEKPVSKVLIYSVPLAKTVEL